MLTLSSSSSSRLFPNEIRWSFENSEKNSNYKLAPENKTFDDESPLFGLHFPPPMMEVADNKSTPSTIIVGVDDDDRLVSRRLNHNASERDRRKKINLLFSSLRSVLPLHDQRKRLSNPATVSQAVKYIPNLQKQVEELIEKKKQLMLLIRRRQELSWKLDKKILGGPLLTVVSTNRLSETEIFVQISSFHGIPLSSILFSLHQDGFHPLNISSSLSFQGRIFYNLHLQVEKQRGLIEYQILKEKVMRFYENVNYL